MKTFLISVVILFTVNAVAQDTLFTRRGETIAGKVIEITDTQIKYRKASNPDGPLYVIDKSDVSVIDYKNGTRDVFADQPQPSNNQSYSTYSPRPRVNVFVGPPPVVIGPPMIRPYGYWSWGWRGSYFWGRPHHYGYYGHHGHYGPRRH